MSPLVLLVAAVAAASAMGAAATTSSRPLRFGSVLGASTTLQNVVFARPFSVADNQVVVVATPQYTAADARPLIVRVRNVTARGFSYRVECAYRPKTARFPTCEHAGSPRNHNRVRIHWMAARVGSYVDNARAVSGGVQDRQMRIEARIFETRQVYGRRSWSVPARSSNLPRGDGRPIVILGQVMSERSTPTELGKRQVWFVATGKSRDIAPEAPNDVRVGITTGYSRFATGDLPRPERVGYVAFYEIARGADQANSLTPVASPPRTAFQIGDGPNYIACSRSVDQAWSLVQKPPLGPVRQSLPAFPAGSPLRWRSIITGIPGPDSPKAGWAVIGRTVDSSTSGWSGMEIGVEMDRYYRGAPIRRRQVRTHDKVWWCAFAN